MSITLLAIGRGMMVVVAAHQMKCLVLRVDIASILVGLGMVLSAHACPD
jgi:hypothetical protein